MSTNDTNPVEGTGVIDLSTNREIILLGEKDVEVDEEWDYVSKDGSIVDMLPYGFCLFLICLVGILAWSQTT